MNVLLLRMGLLLGFGAVFLQIAVFLQPLLPKQYQIAPVCETVSQALLQSNYYQIKSAQSQSNQHLNHQQHEKSSLHDHAHYGSSHDSHQQVPQQSAVEHQKSAIYVASDHQVQQASVNLGHDHHDPNHQCQYCTVYGNLVLPPVLEVKEVLVKIQVRLIAFQQAYLHVWFALQRLFLLPQGRAPPLFA